LERELPERKRRRGADLVDADRGGAGEPVVDAWPRGAAARRGGTGVHGGVRQDYMDGFAVSDDTLLREIHNFSSTLDTGLRMRSARLTKTRAGAIQTWNRGFAQAEADYYQDLIDPQELAPQRAPNLRAEQALPFLGSRVVGRLGGTVTNFQRNEGYDGLRGGVAPGLVMPCNPGRS